MHDKDGRSILQFNPANIEDIGIYKVVAHNKLAQTVARTNIVLASTPNPPETINAVAVSDTEALLRWKQPKYDGNSAVICYSLQYKKDGDHAFNDIAENIDHEFYLVHDLLPNTGYIFRIASRNKIGWSESANLSDVVKTLELGSPKIKITKTMKHLQQITESGQPISLDEHRHKSDYRLEKNLLEWHNNNNYAERYAFVSEIARGQFSIVVKAIDRTLDTTVVAKIFDYNANTFENVEKEFEAIRSLRHERIVALLSAMKPEGAQIAILVMEKLQGADILTYLSSRDEYSEQTVVMIITQVKYTITLRLLY